MRFKLYERRRLNNIKNNKPNISNKIDNTPKKIDEDETVYALLRFEMNEVRNLRPYVLYQAYKYSKATGVVDHCPGYPLNVNYLVKQIGDNIDWRAWPEYEIAILDDAEYKELQLQNILNSALDFETVWGLTYSVPMVKGNYEIDFYPAGYKYVQYNLRYFCLGDEDNLVHDSGLTGTFDLDDEEPEKFIPVLCKELVSGVLDAYYSGELQEAGGITK